MNAAPGPLVSVLMAVYNGESFVKAAIDSVLTQTLRNIELVVINDGSSDTTEDIIKSFGDERIVYVRRHKNDGLVAALNQGIEVARGAYIARLDADDLSAPGRLERQLAFMTDNSAVAVCGTGFDIIENDRVIRRVFLPVAHPTLKCWSLFHSPFAHSSVFIRAGIFQQGIRYSSDYPYSEDYGLWAHLAADHRFANIPEALITLRRHPAQVTRLHPKEKRESVKRIHQDVLRRIGIVPTEDETRLHYLLYEGRSRADMGLIRSVEAWLLKIVGANLKTEYFDAAALDEIVFQKWVCTCGNSGLGLRVLGPFFRSSLFKRGLVSVTSLIKLFSKLIVRYRQHG